MPANKRERASMTMNWILLNIPLGAAMIAFTVGLPLWVMLKYPEGDDNATANTAASPVREHATLSTEAEALAA